MTRAQAIANKELLLRVLRLTEEQYGEHLLTEGMAYLDLYMGTDHYGRAGRNALVALPEYWSWWKRQWDLRNARYIEEQDLRVWGSVVGKWERSLLHQLYQELHAADRQEYAVPKRIMRPAIKALRHA